MSAVIFFGVLIGLILAICIAFGCVVLCVMALEDNTSVTRTFLRHGYTPRAVRQIETLFHCNTERAVDFWLDGWKPEDAPALREVARNNTIALFLRRVDTSPALYRAALAAGWTVAGIGSRSDLLREYQAALPKRTALIPLIIDAGIGIDEAQELNRAGNLTEDRLRTLVALTGMTAARA